MGNGETSAKSMRGSGMEDVIFFGTSNKPSKNIAEVSVTIDNKNNGGLFNLESLLRFRSEEKLRKIKDQNSTSMIKK